MQCVVEGTLLQLQKLHKMKESQSVPSTLRHAGRPCTLESADVKAWRVAVHNLALGPVVNFHSNDDCRG